MLGGELWPQHVKAIGHVQTAGPGVIGHDLHIAVRGIAHLAHHGAVGVFVQQAAQAFQPADILGPGFGEFMILHFIGVHGRQVVTRGKGAVGPQLGIVEIVIHRIKPKAIHPPVHPKAQDGQQPVLHIRIVKVQVRLAGKKVVQVILPPPWVPFPCRSPKDRQPVIRRAAIGLCIGPDIPIGLFAIACRPALREERVLVAGMRNHLINDDL